MMADDAKSRLGRGLAALIGEAGEESAALERGRSQKRVPIEFLKPNPRNPRRGFDGDEIEELAASVRERGIIQPIVVRSQRGASDGYEIIAGERRWRAAQMAGLHEVPIVLVEASDKETLELAIIENVQRMDLNPIEEAEGYLRLMDEFGYGADEIAKIVGKSRPHVANMVRLTKLSEPVKQYVRESKLSAGHARMLVGNPNALELAAEIVRKGLNVRQVEAMARREGRRQVRTYKRTGRIEKDADTIALETRLTMHLGLGVTIEDRPNGGGVISIRYRTLEQLDEVIRKLETGVPALSVVEDDWPTVPHAAERRIRAGIPLPGDEEALKAYRQAREDARSEAERDAEARPAGEASEGETPEAGPHGPRIRQV